MTKRPPEDASDVVGAGDGDPIIRAKWAMDDAATLPEAAAKLREFADNLDRLHGAGWKLRQPVEDDYGFLIPPPAS